MPNWTNNYVEIRGKKDVVSGIKDMLQSEDSVFDFNKIRPMPKTLNIEEGSYKRPAVLHYLYTEKGGYMEVFQDPECQGYIRALSIFNEDPESLIQAHRKALEDKYKSKDELYEMGRQYIHNIKAHGFYTWYDWCCVNWGTKWNACEAEFNGEEQDGDDYVIKYTFDTAWSVPYAVLERLSKLYPEVKISDVYVDEGDEEEHIIELMGGDAC